MFPSNYQLIAQGFLFGNILTLVRCADFTGSMQFDNSLDISRLRSNILKNYDNHTRPVQSHHNETTVGIGFYYAGFEFDEHRGMLTLQLQTAMYWQDEHIAWDPMDYGNLSEITFVETELWRPDLSVINKFVQAKNENSYDESEIDHFGTTLIMAQWDSWVFWIPPTKFQVGCKTDFRLWPYDQHTCHVRLGSWSYHGGELNLTIFDNMGELNVNQYFVNGTENREWKMMSNSVERSSLIIVDCCPRISTVDVLITVRIARKSNSHTAAITVVGLGITMAILVSFWLDPFANERIPLTLLIMVLNSLYLQYMHRSIPNNGVTVPLTICFFRDSLIMVTFAFGWIVMIRYLAKTKRNSPVSLPAFVETLLSSVVATILCLNPRPQSKGESQRKCGESTEENGDVSELVREDSSSSHQEDWQWLARLLDRIAFFFYLITYVIFISAFL